MNTHMVYGTLLRTTLAPNANELVAVSKGMHAVKLAHCGFQLTHF